jgi:hypothetical protein
MAIQGGGGNGAMIRVRQKNTAESEDKKIAFEAGS